VGEIVECLATNSSQPKEYPCFKKVSALACVKKKERGREKGEIEKKRKNKGREKKREKGRRKE